MEYVKADGKFPRLSRCAVALGKFDGIHRGHRKLVDKILEQKENGAQAVLVAIGGSAKSILTSQERIRLLEELGVDVLVECPLDEHMKHMKAETFVREILSGALSASYVAVGEDFRFGFERRGNPQLLTELGKKYHFHTEILSKEMDGHRKISSTYIREELARGNMEKFSALMGMDFFVEGVIEHGRGMGHKYLLPTANLVPSRKKLMPPNGVYITVSHIKGKTLKGITNIGYKPTVGEKFLGVETYFFDCSEDLYGEFCKVEFKKFIRPEQRFHSLEALKTQLEKDAAKGREYFEGKTAENKQ